MGLSDTVVTLNVYLVNLIIFRDDFEDVKCFVRAKE